MTQVNAGGRLLLEKRLTPRERGEVEAVSRLRAEAALLRRLGGSVTPRLVDSGEDALGPWLRTERLPFPTLAERLALGPVASAWVERAIVSAFGALAVLHDAADEEGPLAIVHADLSPSNVAVDEAGTRVAILDLDLATWREGPPRDGAFRGTVVYTSPEIARGDAPPTIRSDLFSLAAVLLHVATGAPPRTGPSLAALIAAAADTPVLLPSHEPLAARGPAHSFMLACLAHEPAQRPASARIPDPMLAR